MDKITRQEALKLMLESNGKFFTAQYVKRTNGKDRTITGRIGVSKHFKTPDGSGSRYDLASMNSCVYGSHRLGLILTVATGP